GRVAHQLWDHTGGPRLRGLAVRVVVVPPHVRWGLRIALRRVLPLLLTAERRDIQVAPGASHRLVAPEVDEVGPVDSLAVADEGVGPVPLVHAEVFVKVAGDRVPRDQLPAHALFQALDLGLGGARNERQRRVPRVQVGGVRDLVGEERAAHAGTFRVGAAPRWVRSDVWRVEGAVDDQLPATLEQVEKAHRTVRAVEAVLLLHRHPWHPAAPGGQRIAGAGHLLLLDQQLLAGGIPLLRRHDRRSLHRGLSSLRYSATTSNRRPHRSACAPSSPLLRSARRAGARAVGSGPDLTPQHAGLLEPHRCFEIAGWDCPALTLKAGQAQTIHTPSPARRT